MVEFPENRDFKLTEPFESPDSKRLIGLIVSHEKRPVPECEINDVSAGIAEPVRMNWPILFLLSTSYLTVSQRVGASCHSSKSLGVLPSNSCCGLIFASSRFCSFDVGSSIRRRLFACLHAVVVFPHHFGPSIKTAPFALSFFVSKVSTILVLYPFFIRILYQVFGRL